MAKLTLHSLRGFGLFLFRFVFNSRETEFNVQTSRLQNALPSYQVIIQCFSFCKP